MRPDVADEHPFDPQCICKLCDMRRATGEMRRPVPEAPVEERDPLLPDPDHQATSFRDFHDNMRKYRRRVFVQKDTPRGPVTRAVPKLKGKALRRAVKRAKVAGLKDGGHERGDNRKVIWRNATEEAGQ